MILTHTHFLKPPSPRILCCVLFFGDNCFWCVCMKWKRDFGPNVTQWEESICRVFLVCCPSLTHSLSISCLIHTHTPAKQIQSVWGVGMERPEPYQQTQQGRQRKQAGEKRQTSSLTHKHIHTHTHTHTHTHSHTHSCWGMFLALRVCGWTLLSGGTVSLCCLSHFHVTSTAYMFNKDTDKSC